MEAVLPDLTAFLKYSLKFEPVAICSQLSERTGLLKIKKAKKTSIHTLNMTATQNKNKKK